MLINLNHKNQNLTCQMMGMMMMWLCKKTAVFVMD